MNGPQALYVNPGCLKCISGINLSPANKNLFIISFTLYFENKRSCNKGIQLKGVLIPKLLNNPLTLYILIKA